MVDVDRATRVVLYTDGLIETRTEALTTSIMNLVDAVSELDGSPPGEAIDTLLERAPAVGDDDIAVMCIDVAPPVQFEERW